MPDFLHKLILSLISGFSELMFVSGSAHQHLYRTVTGYDREEPGLLLAIHLGVLVALLMSCQKQIKRMRYEKRLLSSAKRRRGRQPDPASIMNIRILNTAVIPVLLGFLLYPKVSVWLSATHWIAIFLIINGMVLFLPRLLRTGNKDGLSFTQLDGMLIGFGGALGMVPGFSRMGAMYSIAISRGAQTNYALDLSTLLCIPAICAMIGFDLYACSASDVSVSGWMLLAYLLSAAAAFAGAWFAVRLTRYLSSHTDTTGFAYYSWGLAVFLFLLYLIIP